MAGLLTSNDVKGAYPPASYYTATANGLEPFATLQGDTECDVCVIGGGFTGLSAALHLAGRGLDTVLLDAHRVGWGASGRNGGQIGTGQRRDQDELEALMGKDDARRLWDIAEDAKQLIRDLVEEHGIECDLKPGIIHADHRERFVAHSHKYVEKLRRDYGYDQIETLSKAEIRDHLTTEAYHGGSIDMGAMHVHPLNLALGLAKAAQAAGVRIHERTQATRVEPGTTCRVVTDGGSVSSKFVVLACNGYLDDLMPRVASRTMPINNFVIATEPLPENLARALIRDDTAVSDSKFVVNYYRLSADRRMLFGGGENYGYSFPADIRKFVRPHMLEIYPQLADVPVEYGWGGTLAITVNRMPYFARLAPNVLTAAGYSGHGVAIAMIAGKIMSDAIGGTAERFDLMANVPTYPFPGGRFLRWPLLVLAMTYYSLRDKL